MIFKCCEDSDMNPHLPSYLSLIVKRSPLNPIYNSFLLLYSDLFFHWYLCVLMQVLLSRICVCLCNMSIENI